MRVQQADGGAVSTDTTSSKVSDSGTSTQAAWNAAVTAGTSSQGQGGASGGGSGQGSNPFNPIDPRHYVQNLTHDGDTATYSINGQGKIMVGLPAPGLKAGAQVQVGGSVVVTQHGDSNGKHQATYTVTLSGRGAAGLIGELTPSLSPNSFDNNYNVGVEDNVSNTPSITMTFHSKADALQAVGDIKNLPLVGATHPIAQSVDNVIHAGFGLADHQPDPFGLRNQLEQRIEAPFDKAAQSYGDETSFLANHVTSVSDTTDVQLRLKGQAKLSSEQVTQLVDKIAPKASPAVKAALGPWLNSLAINPRLDNDLTFTRTFTPGQGGAPGTVSYTFGVSSTLDPKVIADLNLGGIQVAPQTIHNLAQGQSSLTLTYALDKQQTDYLAANPVAGPNDLAWVGSNKRPLSSTVQVSGYLDDAGSWVDPIGLSGNRTRTTLVATSNTASASDAFQHFETATAGSVAAAGIFAGDLTQHVPLTDSVKAFDQQMNTVQSGLTDWAKAGDGKATLTTQRLHDDILNGQIDFISKDVPIFDTGLIGDLSLSPIGTIGNTYVTSTSQQVLTQPSSPTKHPPQSHPPQSHPPQSQQLVVLPYDGVNVRSSPGLSAPVVSTMTEGTFVQTDGTRVKDSSGATWVKVTGYDSQRQQITGWVDADFLAQHPQGGDDASGRIDQSLQARGYVAIPVHPGDTIDDIAARNGVAPDQVVVVNGGHIINPDLIFPGDTVYVPGPNARQHATNVA